MVDRSMTIGTAGNEESANTLRDGAWRPWSLLTALLVLGAVATVIARLAAGSRLDGPLIAATLAVTGACAVWLAVGRRAAPMLLPATDPHKDLLDSTGPAMAAVDLDGRLTYVNPSAARMLGYDTAELLALWGTMEIFAKGEGERVLAELQKLSGSHSWVSSALDGNLAACLECISNLPPSTAPGFQVLLRHKDGSCFPVTLHISALRNNAGVLTGLVAVAISESAKPAPEEALHDTQDRYRELFENSSSMTATLSLSGRFLYANSAWMRCFGLDTTSLLELESFEEIFAPDASDEAAALFRRAVAGNAVVRAPLHHSTANGRLLNLEMSLSQRQEAGGPLTIRCLLRDVTQPRLREERVAIQLAASQIAAENASPEAASMRILEALCMSQGWDVAIQWEVDAKQDRLRYSAAWALPGGPAEALIQKSMETTFAAGEELPGRAWKEGRPVWIDDLASLSGHPRAQSAHRQQMLSGWAAPLRAGNHIFAVLEFYSRSSLRQDREAEATVEAIAISLGQTLARSHERGRTEELYRQHEILLDSVTDGICGVDRHGTVSFANPAACRLLGVPPASLAGRALHDVLHGFATPDRRCGDDCTIRRAAGHQVTAAGEDNIFRSDGSCFPAEYVLTPIIDQGRFSGSVLSFRDISQRFALDRLKDEFISTVSHELRTPLTSIRGALGLLSAGVMDQTNEKAANLLRIAQSNSDRLVRLINDILDLERIQSGRQPLNFRAVQLGDLVRQAIDGMQPVADSAGIQLIHDATQVEIAADPDRLLQVLTNLLSNAIKFSPPNSSVSIMLRPGATGVTLSVIDHGRGIPVDKLEAIFGRFQQVDASDSRQKGGSGLGLAICRTIVLQHSGRIWAERNPLRGSTFRVFLPYRPEQRGPADVGLDSAEPRDAVLAGNADAEAKSPHATSPSNL